MDEVGVVGESQLYARAPSKRLRKVNFRITIPLVYGRDYKCQVQIKGIERSRHVYGIDSLQALLLATQYLRQRMSVLIKAGWRFYLAKDDEEPMDLNFIWFSEVPPKFKRRGVTSF